MFKNKFVRYNEINYCLDRGEKKGRVRIFFAAMNEQFVISQLGTVPWQLRPRYAAQRNIGFGTYGAVW
jgi:hypothetical protein